MRLNKICNSQRIGMREVMPTRFLSSFLNTHDIDGAAKFCIGFSQRECVLRGRDDDVVHGNDVKNRDLGSGNRLQAMKRNV